MCVIMYFVKKKKGEFFFYNVLSNINLYELIVPRIMCNAVCLKIILQIKWIIVQNHNWYISNIVACFILSTFMPLLLFLYFFFINIVFYIVNFKLAVLTEESKYID